MQRDDRRKWSIWQLLFPLLLSLCILILRYRLKPAPTSDLPTTSTDTDAKSMISGDGYVQVVERDAGKPEAQDRERSGLEGAIDEEEVKLIEDSDVPLSEEVVEVETDDYEEGSIAESEPAVENEETTSTVDAYCVKCRQKRDMEDPREIETKNGRHALEGTCPVCGTRLFRFIAH
jgi:hypothetical protein